MIPTVTSTIRWEQPFFAARGRSRDHTSPLAASRRKCFAQALQNMPMKQSFQIFAALAIACLVAGCGKSDSPSGAGGAWQKLVMHPFRDAQGTLLVEMPFPSTWKVMSNRKQGEPTI